MRKRKGLVKLPSLFSTRMLSKSPRVKLPNRFYNPCKKRRKRYWKV